MGQQTYETSIQQAIRDLNEPDWLFRSSSLGSGRSAATYRVPQRVQNHRRGARFVGAITGRRAELVHRFDLRVPGPGRPHVLTLHDLPPMRFPDEGQLPVWCSDAIPDIEVICPSQFAASEVTELLGARRVTVIPYGVRRSFQQPEPIDEATLSSLGVTGPFFVHAAGVTQRKNLQGLADAWQRVAAELPAHQMLLLGPPSGRRAELFGHLPRVVMPGRLQLDEVGRVMAAAEAVIVPSVYEGFGLPALEGMAVGTPVIAADRGALPEVCGGAALMTEPDGASIAVAMIVLGRGEVDRDSLVAAGLARAGTFSWEKAARAHLGVYGKVLA
ncbi:alpha-1,3-rhamnosyl/mannosyltransferase [Ornithinimicrobium cerasi]|uniref:Alpha-1,3-rhamnosyl/mannosyltransferase n=3 Tax=Ornithinimicrobium cerasi TaxID=2248773 RepID=A0A285VX38_9MICO|nr:alpha-1,3-rhamnosyl/mannosyltransferase [Ornithinimicrobium cerasi]